MTERELEIPVPRTVLAVDRLVKSFVNNGKPVPVVNGASFRIDRGELVAIMGPSGSGKTTLLTMLGCLLKPTSGSINIMGIETSALRSEVLHIIRGRFIGFIFQAFNLFPHLTVLENVQLAYQVKGIKDKSFMRQNATALLEKVGLKDRLGFLPRDLSGGQKQRVAIARALAMDPPLILADEPTGNLDVESARTVQELLRHLARDMGRTVLIVTHDPKMDERVDRVLRFEGGTIREA